MSKMSPDTAVVEYILVQEGVLQKDTIVEVTRKLLLQIGYLNSQPREIGTLIKPVSQLIGDVLPEATILELLKVIPGKANPFFEVLDIVKQLGRTPCWHFSLLTVLHHGVILGWVSFLVDRNLEYVEKIPGVWVDKIISRHSVAYFIGISKMAETFIAEALGFHGPRISELLIPAVLYQAKQHGCEYVVTTPLLRMSRILQTHYGFSFKINPLMSKTGRSVARIALIPEEFVYFRKVNS